MMELPDKYRLKGKCRLQLVVSQGDPSMQQLVELLYQAELPPLRPFNPQPKQFRIGFTSRNIKCDRICLQREVPGKALV
jgi:hypothetical protein